MTPMNVVSIFSRRRDRQWCEAEKDYVWLIFGKLGRYFFLTATSRDCMVLAASWRDKAVDHPEKARDFRKIAESVEKMAHEPGRVIDYSGPKLYMAAPASG